MSEWLFVGAIGGFLWLIIVIIIILIVLGVVFRRRP